jgi:hypothetical protein
MIHPVVLVTAGAGALDAVAAVWLIVGASVVRNRIEAARSWPQATATVLSSEVRSTRRGGAWPEIRYRYSVQGQTFESSTYRIGGMTSAVRSEADAIVAAHPPGSALEVRYDPERPSSAIIETGGQPGGYLAMGAVLALGALAIWGVAAVLQFGNVLVA